MKSSTANRTLLAYFPGDESVTLQEVTYMPITTGFLKEEEEEESNVLHAENQKYILSQFGKKWKNHLFIAFISLIIFVVFGSIIMLRRRHYEETEVFNLTNATFHHRIDIVHDRHHHHHPLHQHSYEPEAVPDPVFSILSSGRHKAAPVCVCSVTKTDPRTGALQHISLDFPMTHAELQGPEQASMTCQKKCAANRAQMLAQLKTQSAAMAKKASFSSIQPTEIPEAHKLSLLERRPVKLKASDREPLASSRKKVTQWPLRKKLLAPAPARSNEADWGERQLPVVTHSDPLLEKLKEARSLMVASSSPTASHESLLSLLEDAKEPWTTPNTDSHLHSNAPALLLPRPASDISQHI